MQIEILFQDEDLLAVNKPAGLPVHATMDPARIHLQGILEKQIDQKLVLFHRLDLDTTGVVLFGKTPRVNQAMTDVFREREIHKTYWAVVTGRWLPEWREVKTYIAKIKGRWANVRKGGVDAHSDFKVLATNGDKSWLEVKPRTGRTHQIRLHCLEKQHPILGDRQYGKAHPQGIPMALHARKLEFSHPITGEKISIQAVPPSYWKEFWLTGLKA